MTLTLNIKVIIDFFLLKTCFQSGFSWVYRLAWFLTKSERTFEAETIPFEIMEIMGKTTQ